MKTMKYLVFIFTPFYFFIGSDVCRSQNIFQSWYDASIHYSWAKSICQQSNGDIVVSGFTNAGAPGGSGFHLVKISSSGNYIWQKTIGSTGEQFAESVAPTSDGGFVIAGYGDANASGTDQDIYIVKTDAAGNISWQKRISYNINYDFAHSIIQSSDGGYVTCGFATRTSTYSSPAVNIIKLSSSGSATGSGTWNVNFGNGEGGTAYEVIQCADGNYVITGNYFTAGQGSQVFLLKLSSANGNMIWSKTYGGNGAEIGYGVKQTADGGFIIAGRTSSYGAGDSDCFLLKTDAAGNQQWFKTYGNIYWDEGDSVVPTADGGYAMAGSVSQSWGDRDFYIMKTDASGNLLWDKAYGGSDWEECNAMTLCTDGGFALAGRTFSFTGGIGYHAYVIKTDALGDAGCNLKPFTTIENTYTLPLPGAMNTLGSSLTSVNTTFSAMAFSNSGVICNVVVLPVELISFDGKNMDGQNHITWATAAETNNDYFRVEKSIDAGTFFTAGIVKGMGNTLVTHHYSFTDKQPLADITYYRLAQTDFDGSIHYSNVIAVNTRSENQVLIYPQPAHDFIHVVANTDSYEIIISDCLGRKLIEASNKNFLNISQLPGGIYFIQIRTGVTTSSQVLIKN